MSVWGSWGPAPVLTGELLEGLLLEGLLMSFPTCQPGQGLPAPMPGACWGELGEAAAVSE